MRAGSNWRDDPQKEDLMKSRTITIAGTIAALAFASAPVTAVASPSHNRPATETQLDRSRDAKGDRHVDKRADKDRTDNSRDLRDG
jgi:hypothetical protein